MCRTIKDFIALLLMSVGAMIGIFGMLRGEMNVVIDPNQGANPQAINQMIEGLKMYCSGLGFLFFIAGVAYILVGHEGEKDEISTVLAPAQEKKS
jgi:hypothetical protein